LRFPCDTQQPPVNQPSDTPNLLAHPALRAFFRSSSTIKTTPFTPHHRFANARRLAHPPSPFVAPTTIRAVDAEAPKRRLVMTPKPRPKLRPSPFQQSPSSRADPMHNTPYSVANGAPWYHDTPAGGAAGSGSGLWDNASAPSDRGYSIIAHSQDTYHAGDRTLYPPLDYSDPRAPLREIGSEPGEIFQLFDQQVNEVKTFPDSDFTNRPHGPPSVPSLVDDGPTESTTATEPPFDILGNLPPWTFDPSTDPSYNYGPYNVLNSHFLIPDYAEYAESYPPMDGLFHTDEGCSIDPTLLQTPEVVAYSEKPNPVIRPEQEKAAPPAEKHKKPKKDAANVEQPCRSKEGPRMYACNWDACGKEFTTPTKLK